MPIQAQRTTKMRVDTLKFRDRISFNTNLVDWGLLIPNIGVEFDVANTNHNHWAIGLNFRGRFQTDHTFKQSTQYAITGARIYARQYYRIRPRRESEVPDSILGFFSKLGKKTQRCIDGYRKRVKHPKRTYYRGFYVDYCSYSFLAKFRTFVQPNNGHQGRAVTAGLTYGWLRQLYEFKNGSSFDLDLGASIGVCIADDHKFWLDEENNCYRDAHWDKIRVLPALTELKVGFIYRPGKYTVNEKYFWRADVDLKYAEMMDSINLAREKVFTDTRNAEISYRNLKNEYLNLYNKYAEVNAKKAALEELKAKNAAAAAKADKLAKEKTAKENAAKENAANDKATNDKATKSAEKKSKKDKQGGKKKDKEPETQTTKS